MGRQIGLLTAVLVLLGVGNVRATLVLEGTGREYSALGNSNSKVIDEIEYYLELDKSIYEQGENVEMLYRVTNFKDENVTFRFPSTAQWNFLVDNNENIIWSAAETFTWISTEFLLKPGENKTITYTWDMKINQSNLLDVGKYNVVGRLDGDSGFYDFTKLGVEMEVVPEPASILLTIGIGGIVIRRKRTLRNSKYFGN